MKKWEAFKEYVTKHFVETGTYQGEAIDYALKFGFDNISSVELSQGLYLKNKDKFSSFKNVKLYHGDSGEVLWDMIKDIDTKITFWLDGHYHPNGQFRHDNPEKIAWGNSEKDDLWTPLERELSKIKLHPIKEHNIIIDDIGEFSTKEYGNVSTSEIEAMILEINKNYRFKYYTGWREDDILAAYI